MKKFCILVTVILLVLSLCGCSGKNSTEILCDFSDPQSVAECAWDYLLTSKNANAVMELSPYYESSDFYYLLKNTSESFISENIKLGEKKVVSYCDEKLDREVLDALSADGVDNIKAVKTYTIHNYRGDYFDQLEAMVAKLNNRWYLLGISFNTGASMP